MRYRSFGFGLVQHVIGPSQTDTLSHRVTELSLSLRTNWAAFESPSLQTNSQKLQEPFTISPCYLTLVIWTHCGDASM